eukprot:UN03606
MGFKTVQGVYIYMCVRIWDSIKRIYICNIHTLTNNDFCI